MYRAQTCLRAKSSEERELKLALGQNSRNEGSNIYCKTIKLKSYLLHRTSYIIHPLLNGNNNKYTITD